MKAFRVVLASKLVRNNSILSTRLAGKNYFLSLNNKFSTETSDTTASKDDITHKFNKQEVLERAMRFVPEYGWSKEAIVAALRSMNLPTQLHGVFNDGSETTSASTSPEVQLVHYFVQHCVADLTNSDRFNVNEFIASRLGLNEENAVAESSTNSTQNTKSSEVDNKKENQKQQTPEFSAKMRLRGALFYHLTQQLRSPIKEKWPSAIGIIVTRSDWLDSELLLRDLLGAMLQLAGDTKSEDNLNWYSKRAALLFVYKASLGFYLQDDSANSEETWQFIGRLLDTQSHLRKSLSGQSKSVEPLINNVTQGANQIFKLARNILGIRR